MRGTIIIFYTAHSNQVVVLTGTLKMKEETVSQRLK